MSTICDSKRLEIGNYPPNVKVRIEFENMKKSSQINGLTHQLIWIYPFSTWITVTGCKGIVTSNEV